VISCFSRHHRQTWSTRVVFKGPNAEIGPGLFWITRSLAELVLGHPSPGVIRDVGLQAAGARSFRAMRGVASLAGVKAASLPLQRAETGPRKRPQLAAPDWGAFGSSGGQPVDLARCSCSIPAVDEQHRALAPCRWSTKDKKTPEGARGRFLFLTAAQSVSNGYRQCLLRVPLQALHFTAVVGPPAPRGAAAMRVALVDSGGKALPAPGPGPLPRRIILSLAQHSIATSSSDE